MSSFAISVVIPTLNAAAYLPQLAEAVFDQDGADPLELILVDSNSTDATAELASGCEKVSLTPIDNFTHGGARNMGARLAKGDIVVFLTQDALPADKNWLSELIKPFSNDSVAAVCSRQIPHEDAAPMEQFFLAKRFPSERIERNLESCKDVGYENVLFSDVSCAIRRSVLLKYPFDETLIMSEDQQFSRDVIKAGYTVVYEPKSVVIHSHKYTLWQPFKRYFDSIYALRIIFKDQDMKSSAAIGRKYVAEELKYIARKHTLWLPYYFVYTGVKAVATIMAHFADRLPQWLLKKISMHAYHWK
jgi:rhamnosyltransferase